MRTIRLVVAGLALALAAAGCGGPPSLSGVVTLDGQPLDLATVVLTPDAPGAELVVGTTGPDGRFLITPTAAARIAPGTYKVTISKRVEKAGVKPKPKAAKAAAPPDENFPGAGAADAYLALPPETLPAKYSDLSQTVLTVTIPTAGEVTFELSSR